jgi:CPA1 family monovalent cation:H+ antiporter
LDRYAAAAAVKGPVVARLPREAPGSGMSIPAVFVILFSIATAVAIAVRRLRIPYTVALVLVGLLLGALHLIEPPHLTKDLLFSLFLPGLLFEAAFNLDAGEFRRNAIAISSLAVPGVVAAIGLTALIITPVLGALSLDRGFTWEYGLLFGALIAATDPIAVVGLFKRLDAPRRLTTLVDGESLLNDGTSIVLLTLILGIIAGAEASAASLIVRFILIVGGGALVGAAIGMAASQITRRIDEPMIEITLTTIAAYGSFVVGEQLGYSGVIATVVAGMICGNYGRRVGMSPSTRLAVETFWEYLAFALNSLVFLLMGFEVRAEMLARYWAQIAVAYVAMLGARVGVILAVTLLLRRTRERVPLAWSAILTWGGLRGALSMVLALALPTTMAHRDLLVTMTFGVVLASILIQGVTMPSLLERLGIVELGSVARAYDTARSDLHVADTALHEIDAIRDLHVAPPDVLDEFRRRYQERREAARRRIAELHVEQKTLRVDASRRVVRRLLHLEREELVDRLRQGIVRRDTFDRLIADVDARITRLESGQFEDPGELLEPMRSDAAEPTEKES